MIGTTTGMNGHVYRLEALLHYLLARVLERVLWSSQVLIATQTSAYIIRFAFIYIFSIIKVRGS